MSVPDCSVTANAAKAAAQALGWTFKIADANLNINGGNETAFSEALAARPSAIIVHGVACNTITAQLQQAKQLRVPVMGVEAMDCNTPPLNGPHLYTVPMMYSTAASDTYQYFLHWGATSGAFLVDKVNGHATIISSHGTEPNHEIVNAGFRSMFDKCSGCKVVAEVPFNNEDLTPDGPYVQRLRATLAKYPQATASFMPFDANFLVGGAQAVHSFNPSMWLSGGSGYGAEIDLLRQGLIDGITAHDPQWMGWAAMDNLNRFFAGQPPAAEGIGFVVVDKNHNLPPAGQPYESSVNYQAAYRKIWAG
jgi:ribose transport system substrate-binding protein